MHTITKANHIANLKEAKIAKGLGVSVAGLKVLAKAVANKGQASGKGFGYSAMGARPKLARQGLLEVHKDKVPSPAERAGVIIARSYTITPKGVAVVLQARRMGW